ncbi:MAG TPA: glycosyltransferase family 39 protein [Gemmatimonadales bacterium]|nr:glycosyltransferase family 39 protein [Gemmatimonadales bacterium]
MTRIRWGVAAALLATGLLLPADSLAASLAEGRPALLGELRLGLHILRALLALNGVALLAIRHPLPPGAAAGEPEPGSGRAERLALGLSVALALALRLPGLGHGLWFDEIQTLVDYVRLPLDRIVTTYDSQNQHLLYSVAAGAVTALAGESAWALRLPAVLFGVASLWALHRFARLVTDRREAILAVAFLAVSYHHVWFSQNARGYTGLLLWTLLASAAFLRLLTGRYRSGWRTALAYGAAMALGIYTHVTAAFVALAHALVWLGLAIRGRGPDPVPGVAGLALAANLTLLLYAPVLPQMLDTLLAPSNDGIRTAWQSPAWFVAEATRGLVRGLPGGWLALAAGLVVVGLGGASYWRRNAPATALMLLPPLLTAAAVVGLGHNLWPRFFFFAAGFAVLIALRGGFALAQAVLPARWPGPALATGAAAVVIVTSAATVPRAWHPKQDFEGAEEWLARHRAPGDVVVTTDLTSFPYQRYRGRDWPAVRTAGQLEEIERRHRRTWVLYTFPTRLAAVQPDLWARLQRDYRRAAEFPGTVGGGAVVVMVRQ